MYAALGAHLLFLPVYLQFLGFSPTLAGLVFAPPSLGLILLAPRFGRYADRNGPRLPIAIGAATIGVAMLLLLPASTRPGGVDVGCREHLPLRDRASRRSSRRSRPPRSLRLRRISRASRPGSTRRSHGSAASSRSPRSGRSRAGCSSTWGGTGDTPFDSLGEPVSSAPPASTRSTASSSASRVLAFLASVLAATFLRGERQSKHALEREQRHLALQPAGVADEAAVRADHAVAGEHDGDPVAVHRHPDGARRLRVARPGRPARRRSPSRRTGSGPARAAPAR